MLQEIARTGSYSAAGRALGYTQPAVSYQMRCLEHAVGAALAVRVGRTMALTAAGLALLPHADRILASIRAAEQEVSLLIGAHSGVVRLAAFPSLCATVVPAAMADVGRNMPAVTMRLVQAEPPEARELVRHGHVELAVTYRLDEPAPEPDLSPAPPRTGPLDVEPILLDEFSLILPIDHPAAHKRLIGIAELADETWIIASATFERRLRRAATAAGFEPRIMMVADDYVVMQALVANGLGVALIPQLALTAHHDERTVPRTLRNWPPRRVEVELWADMRRVPAVIETIEALRTAAR